MIPDSAPLVIEKRSGKSLILADLHLDHWQEAGRDPFEGMEDILNPDLDFLLIAGDLSNKPKIRWTPLLSGLVERIGEGKVLVFPGNHDYYQFRLDAEDRLAEFAKDAGAEFVQHRDIRHGDTRYLCATLWTDFRHGPDPMDLKEYRALRVMNDYRAIRVAAGGFRKCLPRDTRQAHSRQRSWLDERLAEPFEGLTVVVTHHAPSIASLPPESGHNVSFCYASDLDDLIHDRQPAEWIHGHTHHDVDYRIGETRIRSVSLGYPSQNPDPPGDRLRAMLRQAETAPDHGAPGP